MEFKEGDIKAHREAQDVAKRTMTHLEKYIREGVSEAEIAEEAGRQMKSMGASFWYYGKPALVFVGDRTRLSVSGKDYTPTDKKVSRTDLVTIDLSPSVDGCWGDYARTFAISNGSVKGKSCIGQDGLIKEFLDGINVGKNLHDWLKKKAKSRWEMRFGELYLDAKKQANLLGYMMLDFKGNAGHTIERELDQRVYIEEGSGMRLSDAGMFTFEPHLGKGRYGFKREDIYYFWDGKLNIL